MLHANHAREPHVNQYLFISHSFSKRIIKIHLKILACESQHCLQSNLSQSHSYHGVKRHTECYTLTMHGSHMLIKICSHLSVSQRESSKFHLKIPVQESQHILQSNLSQIHSYHGVKRPKTKRNSNLWEVCFSSAAVMSKLLLGC